MHELLRMFSQCSRLLAATWSHNPGPPGFRALSSQIWENAGSGQDPCLLCGLDTHSGRPAGESQCSLIPSSWESPLGCWCLMSWKNIISDTLPFLVVLGRKWNLVSVTPSWPEVEELVCYLDGDGSGLFSYRLLFIFLFSPRKLHITSFYSSSISFGDFLFELHCTCQFTEWISVIPLWTGRVSQCLSPRFRNLLSLLKHSLLAHYLQWFV